MKIWDVRLMKNRYYEGGVSSVYLWDLEDGGFAGVVLLKKGVCSRPSVIISQTACQS